MTQKYIEPSRQSRIGISLVCLIAIIIGFILFYYGPAYFEPMPGLTVCQILDHYRHMMQQGSLFLIVPGIWLCFYASRILRSGQSPAPGAWVLHRTAIKEGPHVSRMGYMLLTLGILIALSPAYFWSDFSKSEKDSINLVCPET